MRPVLRGLCSYASLKDGSIDMEDLARMNDTLTICDENERRVAEANR